MIERHLIGIDLFCGAGGMSLGFEQAGFDIVAAVDFDPIHVAVHEKNFPSCETVEADITGLSGDALRKKAGLTEVPIDVLFGGPPCSGFSMGGKRDLDDPRNLLLGHFARLLGQLAPSYFVAENVAGLLYGEMRGVADRFVAQVRKVGYEVIEPIETFDAWDFGVPQHRRRVFILGYRKGLPAPEYPIPPQRENDGSRHPTVWDAIGDLATIDSDGALLEGDVYSGTLGVPSDYVRILSGKVPDPEDRAKPRLREPGLLTGCRRTSHSEVTVARFAATAAGFYEPVSRYFRLTKDGAAHTLRAGTGPAQGSFTAPRPIHPVYPRCITVREAARLHSFPDWFQFHETIWHGFRQVGNAVPPLLARAVAGSVRNALLDALGGGHSPTEAGQSRTLAAATSPSSRDQARGVLE